MTGNGWDQSKEHVQAEMQRVKYLAEPNPAGATVWVDMAGNIVP